MSTFASDGNGSGEQRGGSLLAAGKRENPLSNAEMALHDALRSLRKKLTEKEAEVEQYRKTIVRVQAEVRNAELAARYAAQYVRVIERELEIVVGLYNRDRLEFLSLRLNKLRRDHELVWQRRESARNVARDSYQDLHHAQTSLAVPQEELQQMKAFQQQLSALLQRKEQQRMARAHVACGVLAHLWQYPFWFDLPLTHAPTANTGT